MENTEKHEQIIETPEGEIEMLEGEECPMCHEKTLTLTEGEQEVPFFGKCYLFSMDCKSCKFHKADIEIEQKQEPVRYTLEINSEEDMKIRVIKSSTATVKIPRIAEITPGPSSNGYVTNVEGILNRIKVQTEHLRDNAEDEEDRKKAKNLVKKLIDIMWGREKAKMIIEDPEGNSAIISDKAIKEKLK